MKLTLRQKKFIIYGTLAFFAGSGFIIILLGCDLWPDGWWALFVLFGIVFSAIPDILLNRLCIKNSNYSSKERTCCSSVIEDALFVTSGFFACIPFALPFVLMHNRIISGNTAGLVVSGSFLIMISSFIFMKLIYNKRLTKLYHSKVDENGDPISDEEEGYAFSWIGINNSSDNDSDNNNNNDDDIY